MSVWIPIDGELGAKLVAELQRELSPGHVLHGHGARAVARRTDCDDVAFVIDGVRLCVVHLTWRAETEPGWPHVEFVETLPEDE